MEDFCPCGSARRFADCCGPFLSGASRQATALSLMRSRYTAYCLREAAYLLKTWHPRTRPETLDFSGDATEWTGLAIVRQDAGGAEAAQGVVEFVATYRQDGVLRRMHESSRFVKEDGAWIYLDGTVFPEPKPGRNDPCPCGSGKKHKKCCG